MEPAPACLFVYLKLSRKGSKDYRMKKLLTLIILMLPAWARTVTGRITSQADGAGSPGVDAWTSTTVPSFEKVLI